MSLEWKRDWFAQAKLSSGGRVTATVCFGPQQWLTDRPEHAESLRSHREQPEGGPEAGPWLQNVFVTSTQSRNLPAANTACLWAALCWRKSVVFALKLLIVTKPDKPGRFWFYDDMHFMCRPADTTCLFAVQPGFNHFELSN